MSKTGTLPGLLGRWLTAFRTPASGSARYPDIDDRLDRFVAIGERLERGLEELKDLQWRIRENEDRYRDLLDNQSDVIMRRDADGRLTFVNRAFCHRFGLERDAVLGHAFRPRVLAGDHVMPLTPGAAGRERRAEQQIETVDGPRWFEWIEHEVPAVDGVTEVQSVGRDVTDARRTQEELTDARKQAEAANRAKSRFLAAMSHEIRTPMNGILGMARLLGETEITPEQQTYTRAIDRSARQLLTLIDEILDFSKIEADKLVLKAEPFAVPDCVQSVVELLAPKAYEKGIDISWAIDPDLPALLKGDEVRLRQIITNLVGNAIKFTDSGGVLVTARRDREPGTRAASGDVTVAIAVEDTGIGIEPDALPSMFNEFEQSDAAVRRRHGGTGLGLAISRRLARAMSGDIRVTSATGRGSVFTATVRLTRASDSHDRPIRMPQDRHVLLALDRPMERRALALTLAGAGVPAEDGTVAEAGGLVEAAHEAHEPFTSVLVDGECGPEAAAQLLMRARTAGLGKAVQGVVVLDTTAKAEFAEYRRAGFDAYLVRPVRPHKLLKGIGTGFEDSPAPAPAVAPPAQRGVMPAKPVSVMLVEDNDVNALLAQRMLEKANCNVRLCRNGREAVESFRRILAGIDAPVDLVLMDLHMPIMDGVEATRAMLQMAELSPVAPPPIVAVTANAFDEDRRMCLEVGMSDYMAKPFDRDDLHRLIERWCGEGREEAA